MSLDQRAGFRRQVDGREQTDQLLMVLGAGVLLQGLAERLILDAAAAGQPGA